MAMTDERRTSVDQALDVQTVVVEESGRWFVEIIVVFADGVVTKGQSITTGVRYFCEHPGLG